MGKDTNLAHFYAQKVNFCAKSQQKNYSTENKVIGKNMLTFFVYTDIINIG